MKKKLFSLLLSAALMIGAGATLMIPSVSAEEADTRMPEWLITEVGNDCAALEQDAATGYTGGQDVFEFIEIYNHSDKTLDLYEYALFYNASTRSNEKFENAIIESTPIKPGDYLDGSTLKPTEGTLGDLSNRPVNPATCEVAPGEIVVLWIIYHEAYMATFNGGRGMSLADFRNHWSIPDDVKVIAVDGCGNVKKGGGHDKNFNVKNSEVATYGLVKQSAELNAASNVAGADGLVGSFLENADIACWATVDFGDQLLEGTRPNHTYNFTFDFAQYATKDNSYTYNNTDYAPYEYDARREYLLSLYDQPTAGSLTTLQRMTLGIPLEAGESVIFDPSVVYVPFLEEEIFGYIVGDAMYLEDETFTAEEAGVYTFDFSFTKDYTPETDAPTEAPTEAPTDAPTEAPTDAPTDAPTAAPTEAPTVADTDAPTEPATAPAATTPAEGGCASLLVAAPALTGVIAAALLLCRRREEE